MMMMMMMMKLHVTAAALIPAGGQAEIAHPALNVRSLFMHSITHRSIVFALQ
jgi:hypothetical protein